MNRGQIVAKQVGRSRRVFGSVTGTEVRDDGWKYLEIQWIQKGDAPLPIDERLEWIRYDQVMLLDVFEEMTRLQDAMTLSSALLSENYKKILEKTYEKGNCLSYKSWHLFNICPHCLPTDDCYDVSTASRGRRECSCKREKEY